MFEKEVKEYIKTNNLEWELECNRTSPIGEVNQAYQKGAEFGYNKANEWHKVADCDLPKVDNRIVLCVCHNGYIDGKRNYILKLLTRKEFSLFIVYYWKEIVLPKEIKENE